VKGVRLERSGAQRWLVVNDKPENVFAVVKAFLKESNLAIMSEDQTIGVIETDWVENRAKIPQDGLRKLIGKVFDSSIPRRARPVSRPSERGKGWGKHRGLRHSSRHGGSVISRRKYIEMASAPRRSGNGSDHAASA